MNSEADARDLPYTQSKQLLNEVFHRWDEGLCSFRQAKILKKHGLPTDLSRDAAKVALDAIARNNWRVPADIHQRIAEVQHADAVPF